MPDALNLTDAAQLAFQNLQLDSNNSVLQSALVAFNTAWPGTLDANLADQRTVLDWLVPLTGLASILGTTGTAGEISNAALTMYRLCIAANAAQGAGRISAAQANNILSAYNTHIAQF